MRLLEKARLRRKPWVVLATVLVLGVAISVALLVSASIGVDMVERYVPLQDASMMIKHETTMFHMMLDDAVRRGDRARAVAALEHLGRAEEHSRLMLEGGETEESVYRPMAEPGLRRSIASVLAELREMRAIAGRRLDAGAGAPVLAGDEARFEEIFASVVSEADTVEQGLHAKIRYNLIEYEALTVALVFSALLLTAVAGMALHRYANRQSGFISELAEYGGRLEEKERDLAQALDRARESEGKFRVLVEKSLVGVYIIQDARFRYVNPTLCEVLGYTSGEMLAMASFLDLVLPEDRPLVMDRIDDRLSGRVESVRYVSRWLRKDGEPVDIEVMGSLTEYEGRPAIIGTLLDITERKKAFEALIDSETKYRIVADNTYDWEFWLAPDGAFLYTSPSCVRITGYTAAEFAEDPGLLSRILHPADRERFSAHRHDVGESPGGMEFRIVRPDGAERWIEHLCQPVYGGDGAFLGHRGNNRDITERKRLERDRADFYAMVTHDLKSPLAAIMGYAELLQETRQGCLDAESAEMVGGISKSAGKLLRMVEDFLAVSKMESGRLTVSPAPDGLADAVKDTLEEFSAMARKKGLEFAAGFGEGLPRFSFDRKLLQRAVANLLQNAVNYTPQGGRVEMNCSPDADAGFVVISVRDTGPGIPDDEREKVFEKYYRSARTASVRGSGLGLTIVKAVAEAHGGRVEVRAAEGGGSEFRLYLPVRPAR